MSCESSAPAYSRLARALQWLVAPIVFLLIPVGLVMTRLEPGETQDRLFVLHESFGVTLLGLMLLRVVVRLRGAPPPVASLSPRERLVSRAVHCALYFLLLATPIVGWLGLSAFGLGPSFFGLAVLPALLAKDEPLQKTLFALHLAGASLAGALAFLHVAAAARHAARQDGVVPRMWPLSGGR